MQATTLGPNRTGADASPGSLRAMQEAVEELQPDHDPVADLDLSDIEAQKRLYISEAESLGSVPPPVSLKGVVNSSLAKLRGGHPVMLFDKLGERLAFERTGTRLYDALLVKFHSARSADDEVLPPVTVGSQAAESAEAALMRIRAEELAHFSLLTDALRQLGADPTAQTPCADVVAVASSGLMQVLNDPRTTLAQCLNAMLMAELTDNAGWELLIRLAHDAGEDELAGQFADALAQEQEHLEIIQDWLSELVVEEPVPEAV